MVLSIGWNPFYKNTKKSVVRALLCAVLCLEILFAVRNVFGVSPICLCFEEKIVSVARWYVATDEQSLFSLSYSIIA